MRARTAVVPVMLLVVLLGVAACAKEPAAPDVVGVTPPVAEPPAATEPTVTPLADIEVVLHPVAIGFDQPLYVTGFGASPDSLVVLEKTGKAWLVDEAGQRSEKPFLDLSAQVSTDSEQGLLGIAFPPGASEPAIAWVSYTRADGTSVVSSFAVAGDAVDPASEQVLLTVAQPYPNHNGGMIAFGPDGMLYVGMGDGGSGGDPQGNAQNPASLLGKLLRIDAMFAASSPGATYGIPAGNPFQGQAGWAPEIWAYGLRNPWRFSFDRATGDLWIGDVGQNAWEEIDFQPASSAGGENYGWNVLEATHPYPPERPAPSDLGGFTMPVLEYDRETGTSVTGGYVYRGGTQETLWGTYFYADFSMGRIWGLQRAENGAVETRLLLDNDMLIASFGEDAAGELYVVDYNGGVYRLVAK